MRQSKGRKDLTPKVFGVNFQFANCSQFNLINLGSMWSVLGSNTQSCLASLSVCIKK